MKLFITPTWYLIQQFVKTLIVRSQMGIKSDNTLVTTTFVKNNYPRGYAPRTIIFHECRVTRILSLSETLWHSDQPKCIFKH